MSHDIIDDITKDVPLSGFEDFTKEQQRTNKLLEEILEKLSELEHHKK